MAANKPARNNTMSTPKRKRNKAPTPLGVLEFSSALNGDDPILILKKLRQFVSLVGYERRLALSPTSASDKGDDDIQVDNPDSSNEGDVSSDDESFLSFDEEDDEPSTKRQKLNSGTSSNKKTPSWTLDKNNYQVPFVGTSVAKGATGSITPNVWPTGFLQVYQQHSPNGVELISNEYISAVPPNGIHKGLCKEEGSSGFSMNETGGGGKRKKKNGGTMGGQTRGQIISMSLQSNYWMALSEWILGFVSKTKLKKELCWEQYGVVDEIMDGEIPSSEKGDKCTVPPPIMTILMKQRLPEWITAIHNYTHQHHQYVQQLQKEKQQQKKRQQQLHAQRNKKHNQKQQQSKEDQQRMHEFQKQQDQKMEKRKAQLMKRQVREEALLLSALTNLNALCHLSNGTAREVLRKLSTSTATAGNSGSTTKGGAKVTSNTFSSGGGKAGTAGGPGDGTSWMVQLFQQKQDTLSSSHYESQINCLRLVCTLLETEDYSTLVRLTEVPAWLHKQGGKNKGSGTHHHGDKNFGLVYIALRYGIHQFLELIKSANKRLEDDEEEDDDDVDSYAKYMTRLLRDIRELILPPPLMSENGEDSKKGFVLGTGATADLLAGDVLSNLTKLSLLAPPFEATDKSIQDVTKGNDTYENLSPSEAAAVEARRLVFLLLADTHRSPFLYGTKTEEQSNLHLSQLSKALHGILAGQGHDLQMKTFLGLCLRTTPELIPHFFRGLQLSDPKPTYRSLAALAFVEGVLREAPLPPSPQSTNKVAATDQTLSVIVPPCISKNLLGKVVQSPSALLVSSGLKLTITLLRRAHGALSVSATMSEAVMRNLPEVSLLLSIPTRFDPFQQDVDNTLSCANDLVLLQLCEVLHWCAKIDPSLVANAKFDWTRLVPIEDQERDFSNAEPLLQHRILQTLLVVSHISQNAFSAKMLPSVLTVLVSTSIPEVYTMARKLALSLIEQEIFSQRSSSSESINAESARCHKYESSLWVDGVSADTIEELVKMIEDAKKHRVEHKIMTSEAWANAAMGYAMPSLGVSSLLSSSICKMLGGSGSFSKSMSLFLVQITTKMLLFQVEPKPLAAIVAFSNAGDIPVGDKHMASLHCAAKDILDGGRGANKSIGSLVAGVFLPGSSMSNIVKMAGDRKSNKSNKLEVLGETSPAALSQCLSLLKYSGNANQGLMTVMCKMIIRMLQTVDDGSDAFAPLSVIEKSVFLAPADREIMTIILQSAPKFKALLRHDKTEHDSNSMGVVSNIMCSISSASHTSDAFTNILWQYCLNALQLDASPSSLENFLLKVLLYTMPSKESRIDCTYPPEVVFDLWTLVAGNLGTKLAAEVCRSLEGILSALFTAADAEGMWKVYQRVCTLTPHAVVDLCLDTMTLENESDARSRLLSSLVEYDCSIFSCLTSIFSGIDPKYPATKLEDLWNSGHLDDIAATFVLQVCKQKSASKIIDTESFARSASVIGKRFLSLLSQQELQSPLTLAVILDVLEALCSHKFIIFATRMSLHEVLDYIDNGTIQLPIGRDIQIMRLAVCINDFLLLTKAFVRCCKVLPKYVKKMRSQEARVVGSLLDTFFSLVDHCETFDETTLSKSSNVIDACIISCLKYGMMDSSEFSSSSIFGGCLKAIRMVMSKSHSPVSKARFVLGSMTCTQVHAMAISHSSFKSAILAREEDKGSEFCQGLTQQCELIKLLLCTMSLGAAPTETQVKVETDTLTTILSVYNAGTTSVDRLLRRLMSLYEQSGCLGNGAIFMNNLRWGQIATKVDMQGNVVDESWEWFVDALESDRIRVTLSQFPVADSLDPVGTAYDAASEDQKHQHSSDSEEETDDDNSMGEPGSSLAPQKTSREVHNQSENDHWRSAGDDLRYSPGFILPLILATLEAHLPPERDIKAENDQHSEVINSDDETEKDDDLVAQCQSFASICKRMCDRGGIALAVASLSCRCPLLRKVAVSICGLFLKAIQLDESHSMKSWRERPQLEMIMNSIQRGLAVRRALQITRYESQGGIELGGHTYHVPMLPAVSAVFLAKALLVLAKPQDDMYGQVNRYFLRLQDYHGAFQDCFGLPAFLSLYCSSTDDLSRCRLERSWALLTLKDGAVDEFCYRIISQHHVPELIMSSFDSLADQPDSKIELYLTIDVIETLIQSGGSRSLDHLVERQGLLSWLHGIISWRKVSDIFPYEALRCRFLKLIITAVKAYRNSLNVGDDEADSTLEFYEKVPLANAVIKICIEEGDPDENKSDSSGLSTPSLLAMTCDALWAIHEADKGKLERSVSQGLTTIWDATALLKKFVSHDDMLGKVLVAVCDLPLVATENELASAKQFCNMAIGYMVNFGMLLPSDAIIVTLKRVCELMQLFPSLSDDQYATAGIMKCRPLAAVAGATDVWDLISSLRE